MSKVRMGAIACGLALAATFSLPIYASASGDKLYEEGHQLVAAAWDFEAQGLKDAGYSSNGRMKYHQLATESLEKALDRFQAAVKEDPNNYSARSMTGFVLRKLGRHEEALVQYDGALAVNAKDARTMEYRGEALMELGRFNEARGVYLQLVKQNTDLANDLLANMKMWLERTDPAQQKQLGNPEVQALHQWVNERIDVSTHLAMG